MRPALGERTPQGMADEERGVQPATDALVHERRDAEGRLRWRIGIGLTLFFGILAGAMSVLGYLRDTRPASPTEAPAAAPGAPAAPAATGDRPKARGRDGRDRGD
ncbi:MAG: hypothetical protein WKG00_05225 [Polyangiaceae bacterium]